MERARSAAGPLAVVSSSPLATEAPVEPAEIARMELPMITYRRRQVSFD